MISNVYVTNPIAKLPTPKTRVKMTKESTGSFSGGGFRINVSSPIAILAKINTFIYFKVLNLTVVSFQRPLKRDYGQISTSSIKNNFI